MVSRLGLYVGADVHTWKHLQQFICTQLLLYNHLVKGNIDGQYIHIYLVLSEGISLGWPVSMSSKAVCAIPDRRSSPSLFTLHLVHQINWTLDEKI